MKFRHASLVLIASCAIAEAQAQQPDRGLVFSEAGAFNGYTLFAPLGTYETYLIDMRGRVVHSWTHRHKPANSVFLLPDGDLLRCAKYNENERFGNRGPSGGRVERFTWDGEQTWDYVLSDEMYHQHHDIEPLPNGNVLVIAWNHKSRDEAIAAGRKPDMVAEEGIWPDSIVELKQTGRTTGEIVWKWSAWDHLIQDVDESQANYGDVAAHPELIDVNINPAPRSDWMHTNGLAYNAELDQLIISVRSFGEFFVIDHSTTTHEAAGHAGGRAGHGGDILYRWGNPSNYRAGTDADRKLFGQHDARWVSPGCPGAGNITVFNNGSRRPDGEYSSVDELVPPVKSDGTYRITPGAAYGPTELAWSYTAPQKMGFYSSFISGAERLPNGNTLICAGALGEFLEVTPDHMTVWKYLNPFVSVPEGDPPPAGAAAPRSGQRRGGSPASPHIVFRVIRYATDYPGLAGRDLE